MENKISVIIPVYNGEKMIRECIYSLINQTKKPDEIIVVDDGSEDKTADIVKRFKKVRLIRQKHKGPAAARNLGAKSAKGDILLFIDADCKADARWIEEMVKPFKMKEIAGVQGRYKTTQKNLIPRFIQCEIEDRYDRMKKRNYIDFIGSYAAGYRKSLFLDSGGFDEAFRMASGEDPDLSFKFAKAGHKMIFNDKAVVYHRHVDSIYAYLKQKFWRAYWRVRLYKKHPDKIVDEAYTPFMVKLQVFSLAFSVASLLFSLILPSLFILSVLSFLFMLIFTFPLTIKNFSRDKTVAIVTPFISVARTFVFVIGLIFGVLRL